MRTGKRTRAARGAGLALALALTVPAAKAEQVRWLDQGWSPTETKAFYGTDQGSRIMPLAWMMALKQPNGQPFMADSLKRYGYLPNPDSRPAGLPVGFNVGNLDGAESIGMTCAACHTRQIDVGGTAYRIDGGPGFTDLQGFFKDLDAAVGTVVNDEAAFEAFADMVLEKDPPAEEKAALRKQVGDWYKSYHTLVERSMVNPAAPGAPLAAAWGLARADAVTMIFNRLSGLDIGTAPDHLIADNVHPATAPVRYPFLWDAPRQDKTQWPGFAANGDSLLGLIRNLGEVYGVFGAFHPFKTKWKLLGVNYVARNSADWEGLDRLENLAASLRPPKWPAPERIDRRLAEQGKAIYNWKTEQGGCAECHGEAPGTPRLVPPSATWKTPIIDVNTDIREWDLIRGQDSKLNPGVLAGACMPLFPSIPDKDAAGLQLLSISVLGAILQHNSPLPILPAVPCADWSVLDSTAQDLLKDFKAIAQNPEAPPTGRNPYESRVLHGIWAAAPYLHNGSVPTLADLLKPASERPASFPVGPEYDLEKVGLAASQGKSSFTYKTSDCSDLASGNSRCGHEYGTGLSPENKKALLEYLKTL